MYILNILRIVFNCINYNNYTQMVLLHMPVEFDEIHAHKLVCRGLCSHEVTEP